MIDTLCRLLDAGVTQFHVVKECGDILREHDYRELDIGERWELMAGGRYYVKPYPSMLVAFAIGEVPEYGRLNIGLAHTDFPMLKIKTQPDMNRCGYQTLNVEPYGGLIKETWFDRPLGIAGKVVVQTEDPFRPRTYLYDSERAMCIVPSLAPHLRKETTGDKMNVQKELIPVYGLNGQNVKEKDILQYVAEDLGLLKDDILDYDLYLYNMDHMEIVGAEKDMIASPRLDNITSVSALLDTMCKTEKGNCINVISLFDNEEIGSRSKQGADSVMLSGIVDRIMSGLDMEENDRMRIMRDAFMLSLDVAHASHPNYPEKSDPTNQIVMGCGVALKSSASQRYVSDSEASAVVMALARKNDIKVQRQVNRSGMAGGQTLGPIASSYLPVRAVDMGIPILAMHSAMELGSAEDYSQLKALCSAVLEM